MAIIAKLESGVWLCDGDVFLIKSGHIEWECGSWKRGRKPWQDLNCKLNVALAEIERLREALQEAADMIEHTADRTIIYNFCKQAAEAAGDKNATHN